MTLFTIEGSAITDIASFYDELNRLFMQPEDWRLGPSLDALDDLLYGGFGALRGASDARVVWRDAEVSRRALGQDTTIAYYEDKLRHPDAFNAALFREKLAAVKDGTGRTYFDIVLDVFAGHPEIELTLA